MAIGRTGILAAQAMHYRQESAEIIKAETAPPEGMESQTIRDRAESLIYSPENSSRTETAAALTTLAVMATLANYSGMSHQEMPEGIREVTQSLAHPVLGYAGAWAATVLDHNPSGRIRGKIAFAGATIANFFTETVQSQLVSSPEYANFLAANAMPETIKDYLFALGGLGLFLYQNRQNS